nr:MAG TPA: hypothetical protein [Bacteriophage sp.]
MHSMAFISVFLFVPRHEAVLWITACSAMGEDCLFSPCSRVIHKLSTVLEYIVYCCWLVYYIMF